MLSYLHPLNFLPSLGLTPDRFTTRLRCTMASPLIGISALKKCKKRSNASNMPVASTPVQEPRQASGGGALVATGLNVCSLMITMVWRSTTTRGEYATEFTLGFRIDCLARHSMHTIDYSCPALDVPEYMHPSVVLCETKLPEANKRMFIDSMLKQPGCYLIGSMRFPRDAWVGIPVD